MTNLHPLHRLHHLVKTHTDTHVGTGPDGTTTWTLPSGRTYQVPARVILDHPDPDPPPLRAATRTLREREREREREPEPAAAEDDIPPF